VRVGCGFIHIYQDGKNGTAPQPSLNKPSPPTSASSAPHSLGGGAIVHVANYMNTQDLVVQGAAARIGLVDGQVVAGPKMETILKDLLCRTHAVPFFER
jgi:hypothetical protein